MSSNDHFDPALDLELERVVDVKPAVVWAAWTEPERLMKWFCPKPWQTVECDIDLRPGGIFRTVMRTPEGELMPHSTGCYLEIVPNEKLVWTTALLPGFRPTNTTLDDSDGCHTIEFTAIISLTPQGDGTHYRVVVRHGDEASARKHVEMGFHDGWNTVLDQLIAEAKR